MIVFCFISFFCVLISICKCSNLLNFRPTRPFRACCFKELLDLQIVLEPSAKLQQFEER